VDIADGWAPNFVVVPDTLVVNVTASAGHFSVLGRLFSDLLKQYGRQIIKWPIDGHYYCLELILRNMFFPETTQYCCVVFYFARGSGRENMLSDTDAACVSIALALCLMNEKNRRWVQEWYQRRPQHTHTNLVTDLILSAPDYYKILFCAIRRSVIGLDTQDCCYPYSR